MYADLLKEGKMEKKAIEA